MILAALAVLVPVMRLEDAYVPVTGSPGGFQPYDIVGEGFFLWLVAILGLLAAARIAAERRAVLPEPATAAALAVWTVFVALRGAAGNHPFEAGNHAFMWTGHLALFVIVLVASADKGPARRFLFAAVVAGLVLESVRTIWQAKVTLPAIHADVRSGRPITDLSIDSPVALSRVFSSEPMNGFLSPNLLAAWLGMAALAGAGLLAGCLAAALTRRDGGKGGGLAALTAAALPVAALFAWAFKLTGSKGAWLAAGGAVAGMLLIAPPGASERVRRRLRLAGGAALALALAAGAAYRFAPNLPGRAGLAASVEVREGYWSAAATMAGEHPAFGLGPGTFGAHFPALKGPLAEESQSAHCAWLETAAEDGFLGLALFAGFWAFLLWRLWRRSSGSGVLPPSGAGQPAGQPGKSGEHALVVLLVGVLAMAAFGWLKFGEEDIGQFLAAVDQGAPFRDKALALATIRALDFPLIWAAAFALAAWPVLRTGDGGAESAPEIGRAHV